MYIHIIAVGKRMPEWVSQGFEEYTRRLPRDFHVSLIEVPMARRSKGADIARLIREEGERMLGAIPEGSHVVALDECGRSWTTQELAGHLGRWHDEGWALSMLIGGPDGLAPACLGRADAVWSLSPLTLPHPLVRVLLAEQLYRAWSILAHHPYHRP